jgi:hypothetical protein
MVCTLHNLGCGMMNHAVQVCGQAFADQAKKTSPTDRWNDNPLPTTKEDIIAKLRVAQQVNKAESNGIDPISTRT